MNLKTRTSFLSFFIAISLIGRADTLYFIATPDQNHDVNFDFFSPNNWYVPNGMGGYDSAPHNPTSEDDVILVTSANAAANSVVFVSMTLQSGVHVSGGGFSVGTLVTTSGNSFTSSSVEVRNAWHLSNGCSMSMGTITVDSGAFLEMEPGSASLTLDTSTLYVVGQIVMSAGSLINFANGTNQFWIRPNAVVSGSGSTAIYVNPNSGNSISFYFDGTLESDGGLMNISLGNGAWLNTQGLAKLRTSVPNGIIEIHGAMAVPAGATNQVVGPGVTRLYADSTIATVNGLLQVGAVDPDTMVLDPGTLEMDRVLTGSGLTQTISSNGMPSTIIWGNGTVSMPVNIDAWGRLLITNASPKVLSACTLNNAGTAEWDTDGGDLHLNNGAVFNNLSGATFDARNNAALYGGVGAIGKFVNAGEFRKSAGSGSTAVVQENPPAQGAIFNNTGTVNARTGRIVLMGGTNAGAFNMDAGTEIRISAFTNHQVAGSSFSGPGAFAANGSSPVIWLDADCTIPILDLESASALDGPGNLTVTQLMTAVSTTVRGSGLMNIAAGATFNATNATYSNLGRDVNNSGEARVSSTLSATRALFWNNLPGSSLALYGPNAGLDMNYSGAPPSLLNSGSVSNATVNSPNLNWGFTNAAMLQCNPFGITFKQPYMQTAGNTLVTAGSVLSFSKNARILGGTVNGTGAIEGNVFNAATLHPGGSPGILTLNGNFTNASAGVFAVDIAGPAPGTGYSRLSSAFGQLSFDGALHVNFVNGFVPSPGDIYTIAASTNGARVGAFSALQGLHAPNGLVLVPVYGPTNVSLVAASEPAMTGVSHAGSTASFEFQSTAGLTNAVEYTTNLNPPSWITLTTIPGDGSLKTVLDPSATNATRFYRIRFR